MKLTKGQVVTLIGEKDCIVTIENTIVRLSGNKITQFENSYHRYETPTILIDIDKLSSCSMSTTYVLPSEKKEQDEFIEEYIKVAKSIRLKGLKRIREELKRNPDSKRFKRHLKIYENEIQVVDLRDKTSKESA